jgi:dTDP-4-amino-4,6-dideoxygalactose transaminase
MQYIEEWTEARRAHATHYDELLSNAGFAAPVALPERRHVYHIYPICHPERDSIQAFLNDRGVSTGVHYPIPVHLQQAFAELGHKEGDFPHAEAVAREELSLPMFPELRPEQQDQVVAALVAWNEHVEQQGGAATYRIAAD